MRAILIGIAVLVVFATPAAAAERPHFDGQLVVRFAPSAGPQERAAIRRDAGATVRRALPVPGAQLLEVDSVPAAQAAFEAEPGVLYAEPNFRITPDATTNDPLRKIQWNLDKIRAPEAWDVTPGSRDVVAAVIDSGVEIDHPDLRDNLWTNPGESADGLRDNGIDDDANGYVDDWRGWRFGYENDGMNDPTDRGGHGTIVAGVLGATGDNAIGVAGVIPRVRIMPFHVWDKGSAGVAEAIAYADRFGVRVANGSFGIGWSDLIEDALEAAPNLLLSVSAGNDYWDVETHRDARYPCVSEQPNVICVAATDHRDNRADFSNFGAESVDLGAPGASIPTTGLPVRSLITAWFDQPLDARWATGGTGGAWAVVPQHDAEWPELNAWGTLNDSPNAPYPNDADTWFGNAEPLDLTGATECNLFGYLTQDLATGDVLRVEVRSAGGPWELLEERLGKIGFERVVYPLTAHEGKSGFFVRFRLVSDAAGQGRGVRLHNVNVHCDEPRFTGDEYPVGDGTSLAAPHVTGTAALLIAHNPALTTAQLRAAILGTVTPLPGLAGKTVTGGRLDTARALGVVDRTAPPAVDVPSLAGPAPDQAPTGLPTPSAPVADVRRPLCRPQLRRDRRGLRVVTRCDEPARLVARLSAGRLTIARATGRSRTLKLVLTRAGRRRLAQRRSLRVTLRLVATDPAGNRASVTRRLRLRPGG